LITPELKVLLDYTARAPLLRHELMAHFERFKMNNREFVEPPNPIPKVEEKQTAAGTNRKNIHPQILKRNFSRTLFDENRWLPLQPSLKNRIKKWKAKLGKRFGVFPLSV
jgi:hypothetical protein